MTRQDKAHVDQIRWKLAAAKIATGLAAIAFAGLGVLTAGKFRRR